MKFNEQVKPQEIADFLETCNADTKIYLGCDSERIKIRGQWHADYFVVCVVHINGCRGARIFGEVYREKDYDNPKKPTVRLMNEVYKVADLFGRIVHVIEDYHTEVHLDINPDEAYASSLVLNQATGYIKGVCINSKGSQVISLVKPNAFAASFAADRLRHIKSAA